MSVSVRTDTNWHLTDYPVKVITVCQGDGYGDQRTVCPKGRDIGVVRLLMTGTMMRMVMMMMMMMMMKQLCQQ